MDGRTSTSITGRAGRMAALALALAAAGWSSAPALADPATDYAPGSAGLASAQQVAQAYWGADACGGQVGVSWAQLDAQTNARSYWIYYGDPYDAKAYADCRVTFNTQVSWSWNRFCTVLVHEYGHLTGHSHTEDQGDVMYAYYERPLKECAAAAPAPAEASAPVATQRAARGSANAAAMASRGKPRRQRVRARRPQRSKAFYRHYLRRHPGLLQRMRRAYR